MFVGLFLYCFGLVFCCVCIFDFWCFWGICCLSNCCFLFLFACGAYFWCFLLFKWVCFVLVSANCLWLHEFATVPFFMPVNTSLSLLLATGDRYFWLIWVCPLSFWGMLVGGWLSGYWVCADLFLLTVGGWFRKGRLSFDRSFAAWIAKNRQEISQKEITS